MSGEEGEICEVCKDDKFVAKFCEVIGGDTECRELTERAGRGEITQEQYYARVIEKYGREKVAMAMEKALVKDRIESHINKPAATAALTGDQAKVVQAPEAPAPGSPQVQEKRGPGEVEIPEEEKKLATGIADDKEKNEMEERAKAGMPKFKTVLKGMCLPCIGEPVSAIMSTIKLWYTGEQKEKIEDLVKQMRAGAVNVEDALKEVLVLSGGKDCLNSILSDLNKTVELATDLALKMKPELQEGKKEK